MLGNDSKSFTARFRHAMRQKGLGKVGATELAEVLAAEFPDGLSVQTTHKWLNGTAVPRPERLSVLARWLGVSEHWLAFGPDSKASKFGAGEINDRPMPARLLSRRIQALTETQRRVVELLLTEFESSSVA